MEERDYITNLYEEYKGLLTLKQRNYFESYYYEDLSLNEISENECVSKSLVGKTINIVENKLKEYESILHLNQKYTELRQIINKISDELVKKELESIL